jgi:CubicO group peptidase (beta-lactamase class C family)
MSNSAPCYDRIKNKGNVIDAHADVDGKVQVVARSTLRIGHSAGGIYSSIADLSKWVMMQLANGTYGDHQRLFSTTVHQEMWTPQTIIPTGPGPYNTHFAAYGLGFALQDVKGYKQVSHTGGLQGMVTQITMIPELQLGIIVLTNQEEGLAFASITNQIKDAYLGVKGTDRVTQYAAIRKMNLSMGSKVVDSVWAIVNARIARGTALPDTAAYGGTYTDPWLGDVMISAKNGRLWFDAKRSPKLTGEMLPYKGSSFVVKWTDRSMHADAFVVFNMDENGKAAGISMKPVDPNTDFSYDFQDLSFHRK